MSVDFAERATGADGWISATGAIVGPEQLVLERFREQGALGCWCEGGSINLLMKAASLDVLAKHNTFHDRRDAIRRYFEAQCTILQSHQQEVIASMARVDRMAIVRAAEEICADDFVRAAYPRIRSDFLVLLWEVLGSSRLVPIATKFFVRPYDYRSGWPDLTLVERERVRFVEVKTTDHLHEAQIRFALEVAAPLNLACAVHQVKARTDSGAI